MTATTNARGLFTVWLDVPAAREEEFNAWYDLEHISQLMTLPGFTGARRYFSAEEGLRYLAWYETVDETVEQGPAFGHVVAYPTGWSQRIRTFFGDQRERMNFRLVRETGAPPREDAPWLYLVQTDVPDALVQEYNDWHDREHRPRLAAVPGVLRIRHYAAVAGHPRHLTAYELADRNALDSAEGLAAQNTPATAKMRALFTNTRWRLCELIRPTVRGCAANG